MKKTTRRRLRRRGMKLRGGIRTEVWGRASDEFNLGREQPGGGGFSRRASLVAAGKIERRRNDDADQLLIDKDGTWRRQAASRAWPGGWPCGEHVKAREGHGRRRYGRRCVSAGNRGEGISPNSPLPYLRNCHLISKSNYSQILNCTKKSPNVKVVPFDLLYNFVKRTNLQLLLHFKIHFWDKN